MTLTGIRPLAINLHDGNPKIHETIEKKVLKTLDAPGWREGSGVLSRFLTLLPTQSQ